MRRARFMIALTRSSAAAADVRARRPSPAPTAARAGIGETNDQADHQRDVHRDRLLPRAHRRLLADPVAAGQAQARPDGCREAPRAANADWRGGW